MSASDPIDLLFSGMEKLGPGDNEHTLAVLDLLPKRRYEVIVDAGCGTGRQTLALARALRTLIHAVDAHAPFLRELEHRAAAAGLTDLVQTHCMDMKDVGLIASHIDLLWSEGAAYSIGFTHALETWALALRPGAFTVVSELCWLRDRIPVAVRDYFRTAYPDMQSVEEILAVASAAGYEVLQTHTLPRHAWVNGYYSQLEPRARSLIDHDDPAVRAFAQDTLKEIEIFHAAEDSYGYVFYVLERRQR
jgi:trans-aconitate methyltransferase